MFSRSWSPDFNWTLSALTVAGSRGSEKRIATSSVEIATPSASAAGLESTTVGRSVSIVSASSAIKVGITLPLASAMPLTCME